MLLKDKVIIVTGGSRGIGLATTRLLAQHGARVISCSRNAVSTMVEWDCHMVDVTSMESCEMLVNHVINKYGKIDGLVNNAGITKDSLTKNMSENDFDEVLDTNLKGVFNMVKLVGPYMVNSNNGSIVNISSIVAEYGNIGQANYAASKAGIIGATKSWAKEFAMKGQKVRVNALCPGYIMTDMLSTVPNELLEKFSLQTMLRRLGQPEEVASVILFLLSDMASYVTGTVLDVNGGMRL